MFAVYLRSCKSANSKKDTNIQLEPSRGNVNYTVEQFYVKKSRKIFCSYRLFILMCVHTVFSKVKKYT